MARRYGTSLRYGTDVRFGEPTNPYTADSATDAGYGADTGEFGDGYFGEYPFGYGAQWTTPTFTTESASATTYTEE
jgi:hypothetical protein